VEEIFMSRKDGVVLASRTLAVLLTVWGLTEVSVLPEILNSFVHYLNLQPSPTSNVDYLRHDHLISLGFLITRIAGSFLMAAWLFKCGPEVEELLLPVHLRSDQP
jgi:hypothetical protein